MMESISVIIPAWNAARYLAEAITSVLSQSIPADEIIVVDDGSTDSTCAVARKFPEVKLIVQPNAGPGAARNVGVRASSGTLLAFLDADDIWLPHKLCLQHEYLVENPTVEAVFTYANEVRAEKTVRVVPAPLPGTMLIRRAAFERIGEFIENLNDRETADWYLRAIELSLRTHMLSEPLYRRRIHSANRGVISPDLNGYVRAVKASLERRRAAGVLQ